jgi:DnaJ-class molecular chaperone
MAQHTPPAPRICPACDGFATAAVTLGGRDSRGHLRTLTVDCPACHGTGTVPAHRVRESARA